VVHIQKQLQVKRNKKVNKQIFYSFFCKTACCKTFFAVNELAATVKQ